MQVNDSNQSQLAKDDSVSDASQVIKQMETMETEPSYRYTIKDEEDFKSANGAFWEFFGTFLISFGFLCTYQQEFAVFGVALTISFASAFGMQQTGAHYNPAVSINYLLEKKLTVVETILYAISQIAGAITGGFIYYLLFSNNVDKNLTKVWENNGPLQAQFFFSELIGTFMLVLFYNIQTHAYCRLTHDFFLLTLDFFCVIVTARTMGRNGIGILNPAIAIAVVVCSGTISGNDFYGYQIIWIYIIAPIIGSAFCHVFFRYFYAPTLIKLQRYR